MSLKLLVVEGNPKTIWQARLKTGAIPYHQQFNKLLTWIDPRFQIDFTYPADIDSTLPNLQTLQQYHGILWTGGSLNAYNPLSEITRQIDFMAHCFHSGVPIYGSCWGLQIATIASGGQVALCQNGREFGIAKDIQLTEQGTNSVFFKGKSTPFQSLCIHEDEIAEPATNTELLAYNAHSPYQAVNIFYKQSTFFGVQYHPEFTPESIAIIANNLAAKLIEEGIFANQLAVDNYVKQIKTADKLPNDIADLYQHSLEIRNWLSSLS